jgi:hypothetical protein
MRPAKTKAPPKQGRKEKGGPCTALFVGFSYNRRFFMPALVLFVFFVLVIIVVVGISRWGRGAGDDENLLDATCPLLLQASVKLYGIGGHVVLLLTFLF